MGIAKGMVSLLCETKKDFQFSGRILQLGKQDVICTPAQFENVLKKFNHAAPRLQQDRLDDITFFKIMGFDDVESMDASAYEGADIIADLNNPVPAHLKGRYDVIFDGGTSEHIFNFPQVLKNIFDLLKPGGIVIHASPSHNHVDHGFYMFSPTVFYDFYTANKFDILKSYIFEFKADSNEHDWLIYDYTPGLIDHLSFGGWGVDLLGIFFVARKQSMSTGHVTPQQGCYIKAWGQSKSGAMTDAPIKHTGGLKQKLKSMLEKFPSLYRLALQTYGSFKSKKRPAVIARY